MVKFFKRLWLDLTNQTDSQGFTKKMRQEKRKLDKLFKKAKGKK